MRRRLARFMVVMVCSILRPTPERARAALYAAEVRHNQKQIRNAQRAKRA
jgi:hypothetical protein